MKNQMKEFSIYKGDKFEFMGTAKECAEFLEVSVSTVYWHGTPAYQRRLDKRDNLEGSTIVVDLGGWDHDHID